MIREGLTPERLSEACPEVSLAEARRIVAAVHRGETLAGALPQVRKKSLEVVRSVTAPGTLELLSEQRSQVDPFVKATFRTSDGYVVEGVRIPLERPGRYSACISSQAGCALGCRFCATGTLGLGRNLEAWEMVLQVRALHASVRRDDPTGRVHGVVFQGMGEPLANLDEVLCAIAVMNESSALAIDARNMTVCTSGLPSGMRRLGREAPKVRLGLSLHSVDPDRRRDLMPIARAHSLEEVLDACAEHVALTGLSPLWAVTLLRGHNDSPEDARALAQVARAFRVRTGKAPRLSLIPYNFVPGLPFERTDDRTMAAFRDVLSAAGVGSHLRYSGGGDVGAACGQLAAQGAVTPPATAGPTSQPG